MKTSVLKLSPAVAPEVSARVKRKCAGHSIVLVMIVTASTFLVLAGMLKWSVGNSIANVRNNQYFKTVAAAEAATEKVIARLTSDYLADGDGAVHANLNTYQELVPTAEESPVWARYQFSDGDGNLNRTHVEILPPDSFRVLDSQYRGLHGYATAFRVISNAREIGTPFEMTSALRQDIEVAAIPLFQFAIFYNLDLEINPGPDMTVTGPVHCNAHIYMEPMSTLRFKSDVTAVGNLVMDNKPGDPSSRTRGRVIFDGLHTVGNSALNLPIGTNNTPVGVREIVEVPPVFEAPDSVMGKQRYYNKADLVILVRDSGILAKSGFRINNFGTTIHTNQLKSFLTNVTFTNQREGKTVKATQIDIGKLITWNNTNTVLKPLLPTRNVRTIYIADQRSTNSSTQLGVRVVNGSTILPKGLTIATPNPLYVQGHYNAPVSTHRGTTNTTATLPASLVGDSITVLSESWRDSNSDDELSTRTASPTTVNAAFLAGIVQTVPNSYSGGVENFPRFLENWSGKVFTYNGSMVVMFESRYARGKWGGTGGYYNPPIRGWAFDGNYRDMTKLPPETPVARALIRGKWYTMKPNSTTVAN